ncbi:MAG: hypothetical protein MJ056_01655 [Akkermansia sp.]|nr:hypothetical protein [Akkermansia sp.]
MKIGILYIVTGRYRCFWPLFYSSAMKHFFPGCEKHFYIFSDAEPGFFREHGENPDHITLIPHERQEWPFTTLLRYRTFLEHSEAWKNNDYTFFINSDYEFYQDITGSILPTAEENDIVLAEHQKSLDLKPEDYPYERNPESAAYIPVGQGSHYVAGGFIGGKTPAFLQLCMELDAATTRDLERDIIAVWHDESQLNAWALRHRTRILSPWYIWPSYNITWSNRRKVVAGPRDKLNYGGHEWLRGMTDVKRKSKRRRRMERCLIIAACVLAALGAAWYAWS